MTAQVLFSKKDPHLNAVERMLILFSKNDGQNAQGNKG